MIINGFGNGSGVLSPTLVYSLPFVFTITKVSKSLSASTISTVNSGQSVTGGINAKTLDVSPYMSQHEVLCSRVRITGATGTISATFSASGTGSYVVPFGFQVYRTAQIYRPSSSTTLYEGYNMVNTSSTTLTSGSKTYTWNFNIANFPPTALAANYRWLYRFGPMNDGNSWAVCDGGYSSGYYEAEFLKLTSTSSSRGSIFGATGAEEWLTVKTGRITDTWPSQVPSNDSMWTEDVNLTISGYLDVYGY